MLEMEPRKRYTLALALIRQQIAQCLDDLGDLLVKKVRRIHRQAQEEHERALLSQQSLKGRCAHCSAMKRFAEARLYMQSPGLMALCAECQHVLLRLAQARHREFLDVRGMTCLILNTSQLQKPSQ
jgi:hypothetical protein